MGTSPLSKESIGHSATLVYWSDRDTGFAETADTDLPTVSKTVHDEIWPPLVTQRGKRRGCARPVLPTTRKSAGVKVIDASQNKRCPLVKYLIDAFAPSSHPASQTRPINHAMLIKQLEALSNLGTRDILSFRFQDLPRRTLRGT